MPDLRENGWRSVSEKERRGESCQNGEMTGPGVRRWIARDLSCFEFGKYGFTFLFWSEWKHGNLHRPTQKREFNFHILIRGKSYVTSVLFSFFESGYQFTMCDPWSLDSESTITSCFRITSEIPHRIHSIYFTDLNSESVLAFWTAVIFVRFYIHVTYFWIRPFGCNEWNSFVQWSIICRSRSKTFQTIEAYFI